MSASFYTPLKENEIRVLEILPFEDFSETINTTCRIISLASDTSTEAYVALSYTWGAPNNTSYIRVNGYQHKVTPNLESALRHLRNDKNKIVIWVDAVCINQNDIPERDIQLQMMADVYKKARVGLSWLGEESDDSSLAFGMIRRWASLGISHVMPLVEISAFFKNKPQDEIFMPRSVTAFKNMLQRPYWKRVWIQQEVALPPIVTMQCGHERISFNSVIGFICATQYFQGFDALLSRASDRDLIPTADETLPLLQLVMNRMPKSVDCKEDEVPYLLYNMYSSILLESTDPKDKIYALLGLPRFEKYRSLLRPSYTKSASHVFSEAARVMIEEENSLEPIAAACMLNCTDISLPSWVPDWTAGSAELARFRDAYDKFRYFSRKTTGPVKDISDFVSFSADGKILSVTGLLHDEVSFLKGCFSKASMKNHGEWEFLSDLKDNSLPNGLTVLEAAFRIFVGMDANATLDSYRREDFPKFFLEAISVAVMMGERNLISTIQILFGQGLSKLTKIPQALNEPAFDQLDRKFLLRLSRITGQILFNTKNGTLGFGPPGTIPGDKIFHLIGYPEDFILRKIDGHYRVIGNTRIVRAGLPPYSDGGYETIEIH
ncbi:hypothetical protein BGAL_0175g00060 [Botrytis galanthina]|uniref:Heterokaryon incompatibility domain-containing protein n=1 Tax=Botrytis galanthina TaxID=278940 RepID=A0A4S8R6K3_9HELO|nr:hypothetical protein BGAL_0175g00060 [Botrytis galanthina]